MKRLIFISLLFISTQAFSQESTANLYGSDGLSFYTVDKDTLYLQRDNIITPDIVYVWENDSTITEEKPKIILHDNIAYIRETRLKEYERKNIIR